MVVLFSSGDMHSNLTTYDDMFANITTTGQLYLNKKIGPPSFLSQVPETWTYDRYELAPPAIPDNPAPPSSSSES
jgi:hypothetical protein